MTALEEERALPGIKEQEEDRESEREKAREQERAKEKELVVQREQEVADLKSAAIKATAAAEDAKVRLVALV